MANRWLVLSDTEINYIKGSMETTGYGKDCPLYKKLEKTQKRIAISSAKGKGRELQKWVCTRIAELLSIPFDNQDDHCLIHSREMGQSGTDVILRGKAHRRFPFSIECKNTEAINLPAFVRQCRENIKPGEELMVVVRSKALREPILIMEWDTIAKLYRGEIGAGKANGK